MGLYSTLIQFLRGAENGAEDETVFAGLSDIHSQMVREYAESESMTLKQAREHLHL